MGKHLTVLIATFLTLTGLASFSIGMPTAQAAKAVSGYQTLTTCAQPPQGIALTDLSDTQLRRYGLPPHAIISENPSHWASILSHAQQRTCESIPDPLHLTTLPHIITPNPTEVACPEPGSECPNGNWAGNEAVESPPVCGLYREAEVDFGVPTISTSVANADAINWAGVGGDPTVTTPDVLVQDGVNSYVVNGQQKNMPFWEVSPGFIARTINMVVNTGDSIDALIGSNQNNVGYDYFYVADTTSNEYFGCTLNTTSTASNSDPCVSGNPHNSEWNSDSATGECTTERGANTRGQDYPLAQFHLNGQAANTLLISDCLVEDQAIGDKNHLYNKMVNSSGATLASCGPIFNNGLSYTVTWVQGQ